MSALKIGIIPEATSRKNKKLPVRKIYESSTFFRYSLRYCEKSFDKTFVLSLSHGLLEPDQVIVPEYIYMWMLRQKEWNELIQTVIDQLHNVVNDDCEIYFFTGKMYDDIVKAIEDRTNYKIFLPLRNLGGIGKQLQFLKQKVDSIPTE